MRVKDVPRENFTVSGPFLSCEKLLAEKLMVRLRRENKVSIVLEKSSGNPEGTDFNLDRNRDADFSNWPTLRDIQLR